MATVQQNPLTWANCKQQDYDSWREKVHIVFTMNNSSNQARSNNQQMNNGQEPTTKFTTQMLYVKGSTENAEMKMKMKMQQLKHETSNKKTKYIVTPSNWCRNNQRSKTKIAFEAPLYMQSQCRMKAKPHPISWKSHCWKIEVKLAASNQNFELAERAKSASISNINCPQNT